MTTAAETSKLIAVAYAQWPHIAPGPDLADLWHSELQHWPLEKAAAAVRAVVLDCVDFPPKIGQVVDRLTGNERKAVMRPAQTGEYSALHPKGCQCDVPGTTIGVIQHPNVAGFIPCPGVGRTLAEVEDEYHRWRDDQRRRAGLPTSTDPPRKPRGEIQ